ncbi:hypothetical protein Ciccas_005511 [Cichlidogyrus casuarinus]|uniref:DUF7041 domain-containing protein n=1 Tax=Cichlidogyrus casuarinus TaxID=1844966 RepID=A0ABD2Q8G5_9PLAT
MSSQLARSHTGVNRNEFGEIEIQGDYLTRVGSGPNSMRFLLYHEKVADERLIIYASDFCLRLLADAEWHPNSMPPSQPGKRIDCECCDPQPKYVVCPADYKTTFNAKKPDIYFVLLENAFALTGIVCERDRYVIALQFLDDQTKELVITSNIKMDTATPYTVLKNKVLQSLKDSDNELIEKIFKRIPIGGRRPQQYLAEIR